MARLLRIEDCAECPHWWAAISGPKCTVFRKEGNVFQRSKILGRDGIPDWCPLPEAEEATDADR